MVRSPLLNIMCLVFYQRNLWADNNQQMARNAALPKPNLSTL
jgi:hypothetical protein